MLITCNVPVLLAIVCMIALLLPLPLPLLPACAAASDIAAPFSNPTTAATTAAATAAEPVSERDVLNRATTVDKKASFTGRAQDKNMRRDVDDCTDLHSKCDQFADDGICESQPGMMAVYCPVGV